MQFILWLLAISIQLAYIVSFIIMLAGLWEIMNKSVAS